MIDWPQVTVVVADACTVPVLEALADAVFGYAPQLDAVVELVTCTDAVTPAAKLPKLQVSVPPAIAQVPGPLYDGLMLQLIPVPEGSVSVSDADVALPTPLLLTESVYPIEPPADTVAASAVLVRLKVAAWLYKLQTSEAVNARL